jgi:hypothetical protein
MAWFRAGVDPLVVNWIQDVDAVANTIDAVNKIMPLHNNWNKNL